ncbi:MAG TPA: glutamine--tRNA ligase/YqeY domain fusion protein [Fimbriimonadaceae bacterium]|nr:glutamine--tRNA ligase/YqeY domain fusion protein [Fimbriimonadaceae bacterium]
MTEPKTPPATDFIREAIREDLASGRFDRVHTRFPPEPNAYLHIGHAKAIWIDYLIAHEFGGQFNLRFDDTNPLKEEQEFVDGIIEDVHWVLSALPPAGGRADVKPEIRGPFFGSDYFDQMYEWALQLIRQGDAFVCDLSAEEMNKTRGTLTSPGENSPWRDRSIQENLDLFQRMRAGEFPDGARTLRAKIDMSSPNVMMRDPVMYRIRHAHHHRQGDKWCIYPTYDWAHGLEDSIEGITHSLCTLEYEIHRPLYDWFLERLGIYHPRQIEFARLGLTYTVMSKRRFVELVEGGHVAGYDDPRLPTLAGMRRRGYTPEAIAEFCRRVGVGGRADVTVEPHLLEDCIREDLNKRSPRVMAVLDPLKVVITNYPEGQVEELDAVNNPEDPSAGTRRIPFGRELYIERDDFREEPPPKFFRLAPGREVRLRYGYFIRCEEVVKDARGEIVELRCSYDPATRGGDAPDGRKVKATLHWVAAESALPIEARLYDHLFVKPDPDDGGSYLDNLNPNSLKVVHGVAEPSVADASPGTRYQFERLGYFCVDGDSTADRPVFNRTATLRDTWAKIAAQ